MEQQLDRVLCHQIDADMRRLLTERIAEMLRDPELANFRTCVSSSNVVPLSLYDVARRLPESAIDPMEQLGELFASLLKVKQNYQQVMGTQTAHNATLAAKFEEALHQLFKELSRNVLGSDLPLNVTKYSAHIARFFPVQPTKVLQQTTPTQQDFKNLEEMLLQVPSHHGRSRVFGEFLREIGTDYEKFVREGNQIEIDFTQIPAQQFWTLYNIARKHAPGVK